MNYTQCKLTKNNITQVAWIPSTFAVKGKMLKIKVDGEWDYGWLVIDTYTQMSEEYVIERERDYKYQRDASDINRGDIGTTISKVLCYS